MVVMSGTSYPTKRSSLLLATSMISVMRVVLTMDGIGNSVTWHSNMTWPTCAKMAARSNGGVNCGLGVTIRPFVCLEGNIGKILRRVGVKLAQKYWRF